MTNQSHLLVCLLVWLLSSSSVWADESAFLQGKKAYDTYRFSLAIPSLERALASGSLSQQQQIDAHLMLAISHYNQTRSQKAAEHYKQALQLKPSLPVPAGQSPPATAFFRRIRSRFVPLPRTTPKAPVFRMVPQRVRPQPPPARQPFLPVTGYPRARVALAPPLSRKGLSQGTAPPLPFWQKHKISLLVGAAGLLTLCVGVGLGAAFQLQKSALDRERQDKTRSGEQILASYQQTEALVVPTNVVLISGSVLLAAAGGIFAAEWFLVGRRGAK